jgi:hypothetical protein
MLLHVIFFLDLAIKKYLGFQKYDDEACLQKGGQFRPNVHPKRMKPKFPLSQTIRKTQYGQNMYVYTQFCQSKKLQLHRDRYVMIMFHLFFGLWNYARHERADII